MSAPAPPALSFVICTHRRPVSASRAARGLQRAIPHSIRCEVVIVDSGGRPGDRAQLRGLARSAEPRVTLVDAGRRGLSLARNVGASVATGDVLVYIDDDVIVSPELPGAYDRAFADPHVGLAGGPIVLRWPGRAPPRWFVAEIGGYWSALDGPDRPGPLAPADGPYGANLAVRRSLVAQIGGFSTDLGRVGTSLGGGEDRDLAERVAHAGVGAMWVPSAIAHHVIDRDRARLAWLARRSWAQGRDDARLGGVPSGASRVRELAARARSDLGRSRDRPAVWMARATRAAAYGLPPRPTRAVTGSGGSTRASPRALWLPR